MFVLAENKDIGKYLSHLIKQQYRSVRQFGKAYIEEDGRSCDEEELRKMSNRLSQILNGKKSVQIYDLPIFTKLLGVSCEGVLSAGKCFAPSSDHLTNYAVAFSKGEKDWEEYVKRDDKLILNADEYGKTVIDYALQFKNYEFMKFLMRNGYIWFVGANEKDYYCNFGAGTSIENNSSLRNFNVLDVRLKEEYNLRMSMIVLAIEHGDTEMLTELRAREIPSLYQANYIACKPADCEKYYDRELLNALASASDEILEYFSEEFEITDQIGRINKFVFPFLGELIDMLIENKHEYAQYMLKNAVAHNQYAYDRLSALLAVTVRSYDQEYFKCDIINGIMRELDFYDNGDLVSYRDTGARDGIITNLVRVKSASNDPKTGHLIQELNELYYKIKNITPKV